MAKIEQDREDILREATALLPRAELRIPNSLETVVFGFRQGGALSLFFGADPVFQFNSAGELRRAYRRGALLKAVKGKLHRLERTRTAQQALLLQSELNEAEESEFLADLQSHVQCLQAGLHEQRYELVAEVPAGSGAVMRLSAALESLASPPRIAARPNVT